MPAAKHKKFQPSLPNQPSGQVPTPDVAARTGSARPSAAAPPSPSESLVLPPSNVPIWHGLLAALLIVLAGLAAYSNSFHGDFVLDDLPALKENATIQNGWATPPPPSSQAKEPLERLYERLPAPLQPPNDGQTVTGRPLVNVSFALNYAWAKSHQKDGFAPEGYHAVNLAIHLLAGLALFGLIRRTLELPKLRGQFGTAALPVALMAALWWTVHPLQTESVTYLSQRAESLMSLFYLLTFYCFVRGTQKWPWLWMPLAILACATAVFCKEVTITLPVMLLLYDWIFVSKKLAEPLRRRWPAYAGLLLALLPLAWLVHHAGNRGHSAGFGMGVAWYDYAVAQFSALMTYLKLTFWPHPLVIDYSDSSGLSNLTFTTGDCLAMFVVMLLAAGTVYLLWRKPTLGFLGAWFFVILAPSSSILPIVTEQAAEHRMYLPLASLAVFAALGLWKLWQWRALPAALAVTAVLGALTFARNDDYRSGLVLWRDAVAKHPNDTRAHENFGIMLYIDGRVRESIEEFLAAERIKPNYPDCDNNLGNALGLLGRNVEAAKYYMRAIPNLLRPRDQAIASYNLGNALVALQRWDDAINAYSYSASLAHYSPAFNNLGSIYAQQQKYDQALACYTQALNFQPIYPQAESNLADTYAQLKQPDQAEQHYLRAIQQDPNYADAHGHLGVLYANLSKYAEAAKEFSAYIQLSPPSSDAHFNLGICLANLGKPADAAREFQAALDINPNNPAALSALARIRAAGN